MGKYYTDYYTAGELRTMSPDALKEWQPHYSAGTPGDFHGAQMAKVPLKGLTGSLIYKPALNQYELVVQDSNGDFVGVPGLIGAASINLPKSAVMPLLADIADSPMNQSRSSGVRSSTP